MTARSSGSSSARASSSASSAAGFGLAQVISFNVFHRTVEAHVLILIGTVLASILVSTLASLIPVRRAVDVDPAPVLRGE